MQTLQAMVSAATACLDEDELFALARGQVAGSALARVESHLKDCADCCAVLAEAARTLEPAADESVPGAIARYRVEALLGAGASGLVYRGFDPQLMRAVALKLLRPEALGAREPSERLLREAQAMARLSDPHVVTVYDVGVHQGMVYLVMEYVDGHTLSQWLIEAPRSRPEVLRVFAEAGRGLHAAHQKGLVHRDFKPENVMVSREGRARVTDFGLARESESWLAERSVDDQASTELYAPTRGLIGTPAYMAPELFEGGRASAASDQFAFCVALFVALFDKHPFKAGEGIGLSELVTRVRGGTLQHPALADAGAQRLFSVLQRGLAAQPSARFADMSELLSALERAPGRRRRGLFLLVALVVVTALATVVPARLPGRRNPVGKGPIDNTPAAIPQAPAPVAAAPRIEAALPTASAGPTPVPTSQTAAAPRPSAPATATAPLAEKRRAPKPGDVRYKDWLKDPF
ncbi:MAG TPA: serine/threonine-protein kinase [Polyangiaceae bacterium]|nr:serine/threonine-protein kinase [Polyangiaceae bacterium]